MDTKSTKSAFQKLLPTYKFSEPVGWAEEFAQKRFLKKMEFPDLSRSESRRTTCWSDWLRFDRDLPSSLCRPPKEWYIARLQLHKELRDYRIGTTEITSGSMFTPTKGKNSLESKLAASQWDCTPENFEQFSRLMYNHHGLRQSVKKRFSTWCRRKGFDEGDVNRRFYRYHRGRSGYLGFNVFCHKLRFVTNIVHGSRFSTVPKNNDKDRPINIEPFGNILVQRAIGNGIRDLLRTNYGVNLDTLAQDHRRKISDLEFATIDLSNASDSVSKALCEFLLPTWFLKKLYDARSPFILGPDKMYHEVSKISSMGNGYTFELMTLLLLSLGKVFDDQFSVYGDDILIPCTKAPRFISVIESIGFVVNKEKSFVDGPFRESCGANYHETEGYIESFDFVYPQDIHDCVVIFNKTSRLARRYPSFEGLRQTLLRCIPLSLRGPCLNSLHDVDYIDLIGETGIAPGSHRYLLSGHFQSGLNGKSLNVSLPDKLIRKFKKDYSYEESNVSLFYSFRFVQDERTAMLSHLRPRLHWAKYLMYLSSGRRAKDVIRGEGQWVKSLSLYVDQSTFRWKDLRTVLSD